MKIAWGVVLLLGVSAHGQTAAAKQVPAVRPAQGVIASHPDWPAAKVSDVDSVEHILAALYGVISGPPKQPRDWVRMRSLFLPDGRLIPTRHEGERADVTLLSIDDYIGRVSARFEAEGFYERSTHNEVETYGSMVHVFSTYESRHAETEAQPFARGINSIELLKDGGRYWIVEVFWDAERPQTPIPPIYIPVGSDAAKLNQNMTGAWVGQLEYRDYQTDQRVFLPTWLNMTPTADGNSVRLSYLFDDGPAKTVREETLLTFGDATATVSSEKTHESYVVSGLENFRKLNRGTLVLTGPGKENDKPVDVRITILVGRNLFTLLKETKVAGAEFRFRDQYTMTRERAPQ